MWKKKLQVCLTSSYKIAVTHKILNSSWGFSEPSKTKLMCGNRFSTFAKKYQIYSIRCLTYEIVQGIAEKNYCT